MTRQEALKLVAILEAAYPRQELRRDTVEIYAMFLQDLDYKLAERVIAQHIRTQKWFPAISEIREACAEMVHQLPTTEQALAIVRDAVRTANYSMVKSNDLLHQAVDTVGWHKLLSSEYSEPLYRQIKEAYEKLRTRELQRLTALPKVGQDALDYLEGGDNGGKQESNYPNYRRQNESQSETTESEFDDIPF